VGVHNNFNIPVLVLEFHAVRVMCCCMQADLCRRPLAWMIQGHWNCLHC